MDKVIIDGVYVSGCEHYRAEIETKMPYGEYEILKDKCHYSGIEIIQDCKGNKGCIYKQLKRLQAENDNLKDDIDKQQLYVDSLEQENQILKEKLQISQNSDKKTIEIIKENERLKEEKGGMQILIDNYIALTEKYHQALQEIRKMLKGHNVADEVRIKSILAKINEVIGAKE